MTQEATTPKSTSRYLLTGAKGFIGAWIVRRLIERGDTPWIYDLDTKSHRLGQLLSNDQLQQINFVQGDVTNFDELDRAVAENGITHLIHLAALQVPFCAADPLRGARVNVLGTLNAFEVVRKRQDLIKRIVYASSGAVFGPEEFYGSTTVPEGAPLQPNTHYGVYKQANEGNARVYYLNNGISSVGLRPGTVYGVGRDQGITSGPTKAIKATVAGQPYTIHFTGGFDMQYARDTAEIFLRCAESQVEGAKTYTLRGVVIQMDDFLATLNRLLPKSRELIRAEGKPIPIAYDFDDSALVRDIGNVPRTPLEDGIRETAEIFGRLLGENRLDTADLAS
ncbi:MAG TPA: NAD-dependent epimerase/dehydratase family protein [Terriglobia bacterium]|nr:NAD-dependent epimerase/dehydratase family protein [Terriglobia bacterium]